MRMINSRSNSGVALMVVLIILMVMAIFTVIIISQSMSQSKTSHSQMEQIVAEELAKGAFWKSFNSETPGGAFSSVTNSHVILNNRDYTVSVSAPDPAQLNSTTTSVTY